jgi:cytosine/adenosine deaminase-related metal-dependent hydrolase
VLHLQVRAILDVNGKVGLGVDGSSSNETVNLMDDCRIATYLQRSGGNPKGVFSYSVDVEMQLHVHRHLPLLLL